MQRQLDATWQRELESIAEYPQTDGLPMSDSTLQYDWMTLIVANLKDLFADRDNVFVAGDLFWYPVEKKPKIVVSPDAMVAFDRPNHHRMSYRQWEENNIPPAVVFEVLSDCNTSAEMEKKFEFYQQYGVQEYYIYDPKSNVLTGYVRHGRQLREVASMNGFHSPRLQIGFDLSAGELVIVRPGGLPFRTLTEVRIESEERQAALEQEQARSRREHRRAETAIRRAEKASERAETAEAANQKLAAKLRELGIDPDSIK